MPIAHYAYSLGTRERKNTISNTPVHSRTLSLSLSLHLRNSLCPNCGMTHGTATWTHPACAVCTVRTYVAPPYYSWSRSSRRRRRQRRERGRGLELDSKCHNPWSVARSSTAEKG